MLKLRQAHPQVWFFLFVMIHVATWTIAPAIVRYNLPMDAMEGATWGKQLQLGYDKNPFLNGWLTALAIKIGGYADWVIYLFSQLSVALCFWAIWTMGKKMLSPWYALIAVFLLEGMQYYNLHAIDLSDNALELSTWGMTTLYFYLALTENKFYQWLLCAMFAGLALMTKYYSIFLFLSLLGFMISHPIARRHFMNINFYVAIFLFFIIILPHFVWSYHHEWVTLNYTFTRIASKPSWSNHIFFPAQFAWQQFEVMIPTLILFITLLFDHNGIKKNTPIMIDAFNQQFIIYAALGPFLLTLLLSALTGITLRAAWGMPLFSWLGILLLSIWQPELTPNKFYRFFVLIILFLLLMATGYCFALIRASETSSALFPGKIIADQLTAEWHERFHTPLNYVIGARWIAGNISFYSHDHPSVFINADKKISPWINQQDLKKAGGIVVMDARSNEKINFTKIPTDYPGSLELTIEQFAWHRNQALTPIELQVAWIAPQCARSNT